MMTLVLLTRQNFFRLLRNKDKKKENEAIV